MDVVGIFLLVIKLFLKEPALIPIVGNNEKGVNQYFSNLNFFFLFISSQCNNNITRNKVLTTLVENKIIMHKSWDIYVETQLGKTTSFFYFSKKILHSFTLLALIGRRLQPPRFTNSLALFCRNINPCEEHPFLNKHELEDSFCRNTNPCEEH